MAAELYLAKLYVGDLRELQGNKVAFCVNNPQEPGHEHLPPLPSQTRSSILTDANKMGPT